MGLEFRVRVSSNQINPHEALYKRTLQSPLAYDNALYKTPFSVLTTAYKANSTLMKQTLAKKGKTYNTTPNKN